jgi:hypothetical protein
MGAITDRLLSGKTKPTSPPKLPKQQEGGAEFPDMPEISSISTDDLGFWESLPVNLKTGLTIDPIEKTKIISKHFAGDPRLGGAKLDKFNNPILTWKGKDYYVNKPGISRTDITDVIAQTAQLMPASRFASIAPTAMQRFTSALPAYFGTNIAQQYGTRAAGGKDVVSVPFVSPKGMQESGWPTLIGATAEAILPPVIKAGGKLIRSAIPASLKGAPQIGATSVPPSGASPIPPSGGPPSSSVGPIPLTKGQRTGDPNLLRREEAGRRGAYGESASDLIKGFDERQMAAVRGQAAELQPGQSGFGAETATDIGETLQTSLQATARAAKKGVGDAYTTARELSVSNPALLNREGVLGLTSDILTVPKSMEIAPFHLNQMPLLKGALDQVKRLNKLAKNERFKPQNFSQIESTRKALGQLARDSDGTQREGIRQIIGKIDDWTDDAIENGLLNGDEATLAAIKNARGLARDYFKKFGKEKGGDPAGSALEKILDTKQASPMQVVNYLTGSGNIKAGAIQIQLAKRIKNIFGDESREVTLLKDALIMKAFTGKRMGDRLITRGDLVKRARDFLTGDGRALSMELFSEAERGNIKKLVDTVAKTITPDDALNPSKSAWAIARLLIQQKPFGQSYNPISMAGKVAGLAGESFGPGKSLKEAGGMLTARNLMRQTDALFTNPLVTSGTVATALKAYDLDEE